MLLGITSFLQDKIVQVLFILKMHIFFFEPHRVKIFQKVVMTFSAELIQIIILPVIASHGEQYKEKEILEFV